MLPPAHFLYLQQAERLRSLAMGLAAFLAENGMTQFSLKWMDLLESMATMENLDHAILALEELVTDERAVAVPVGISVDEDSASLDGKAVPLCGFNDEQKEAVRNIFARYDLDGSGTIYAVDEFEQLVTNATFKLALQIPTATLNRVGEAWLAERGDISQHPITFEEFWEWFGANFGDAGA